MLGGAIKTGSSLQKVPGRTRTPKVNFEFMQAAGFYGQIFSAYCNNYECQNYSSFPQKVECLVQNPSNSFLNIIDETIEINSCYYSYVKTSSCYGCTLTDKMNKFDCFRVNFHAIRFSW